MFVPFSFKVVVEVFHQVDRVKEKKQWATFLKRALDWNSEIASSEFFEEMTICSVTISENWQNLKANFCQSFSHLKEMLQ